MISLYDIQNPPQGYHFECVVFLRYAFGTGVKWDECHYYDEGNHRVEVKGKKLHKRSSIDASYYLFNRMRLPHEVELLKDPVAVPPVVKLRDETIPKGMKL